MQRRASVRVAAVAATLVTSSISVGTVGAAASTGSVPAYDHIFVIVEENHGLQDVIGNPAAPNLNALAQQFGIATDYFGVTHPSEPNYVALLGGDYYGIQDDNAYYTHNLDHPSLISQLDAAGIAWKAYLQGLPHPDYQGICYPANCNGAPDKDPLYASKHDGIQNFTTSRTLADWNRQVPIEQLTEDIASGSLPRFGYIVPDECHDEHGDPPYCLDSGNIFDPQDQHLVTVGDQYLGSLVSEITNARFWSHGNNAIAIVYDEGDNSAGCCDSNPGGGKVAAVVVTSHGPRGVQDGAAANHYSLLATIQQSFGLGCLANTCDTAKVKPLAKLFAVTGSSALATSVIAPPRYTTPTPIPSEPTYFTAHTPSGAGWSVVAAPLLGQTDNSLGSVAVTADGNVWAAGDFLPSTHSANPDATLPLVDRWNGASWTAMAVPKAGANFGALAGITAAGGDVWAVGMDLDAQYRDRALVDEWNGSAWSLVDVPQPGTVRDILFAVSAVSDDDVWAVGDQEGANGVFETLVEHFDGSSWHALPSPDPGTTGNHLYGVAAVGPDNVWAVGEQLGATGFDRALVLHWDGVSWHVVPTPSLSDASSMLFAVSAADGRVFAVGQSEGATDGAHPLVEHLGLADATVESLPALPSAWSELWGVAVTSAHVWAVGTTVDASGNNQTVVMRGDSDGSWHLVDAPNPGSGSHILGGAAAGGGRVWAVGVFDNGGNNRPLVEWRLAP